MEDDLTGAAILFWLPPERKKLQYDFDLHLDAHAPPHDNPQAWWEFRDAVFHANEVELQKQTHSKLPWIKVGNRVLSPERSSWCHPIKEVPGEGTRKHCSGSEDGGRA